MDRLRSLLILLALERDGAGSDVDWFAQLDGLGRGDVASLAQIRRLITSQLMRMGAYSQRDAWDDLAQEVVVRVWRAYRDDRIREARGVPGFVRTTTRNAFIDWTRSHRREVDLSDEAVHAAHDEPDQELPLDPAMQLVLRSAIATLSERHREVVQCLYLEGLSYDETAARLDRPRGTVNRQQREAITALRERLLDGDQDGGAS